MEKAKTVKPKISKSSRAKSSHHNSEDEDGVKSNKSSRRASVSLSPQDTSLIEIIAKKSHADNDRSERTERTEKKAVLTKTKDGTNLAKKTKAKKDWSNAKKKVLTKTSSDRTCPKEDVSVRTVVEKTNRSISSRTDVSERSAKKSERPALPSEKAFKEKVVQDQCASDRGSTPSKDLSEKCKIDTHAGDKPLDRCCSERTPLSSDIVWKRGETKFNRKIKKPGLSAEMVKEIQKESQGDDKQESNLLIFELEGLEDVEQVMKIIGVNEGDILKKKVIGAQGGVKRPIKVTLKNAELVKFALSYLHKLEDDSRYSEVHFSDLTKDRTKEEQREHRRLIDQSRKNSTLSNEAADEITKLREVATQRDVVKRWKRRTSTIW